MSTVNQNIKKQRMLCNLTQEYVAKQLNISIRKLGALERGETRIHLDLLTQIAKILQTNVETLLGLRNRHNNPLPAHLQKLLDKIDRLSADEQELVFQLIEKLAKD